MFKMTIPFKWNCAEMLLEMAKWHFAIVHKIIFLTILVQIQHLNVTHSPLKYTVLWLMETQQPSHRKAFQMRLMYPESQSSLCGQPKACDLCYWRKMSVDSALIISHTQPAGLKFPREEIPVFNTKWFFFLLQSCAIFLSLRDIFFYF